VHALRGLLKVVDEHWAEVSAAISRIEAFAEDDGFDQRGLASLLASKARAAAAGARRKRPFPLQNLTTCRDARPRDRCFTTLAS
jgi:hypothetical protein